MTARGRGWAGRRGRGREDGGYTLVELLVAMSLFAVLIAIYMAGIVQMTRSTNRVRNVTSSTDEGRRAFDRFDRQIRYASAVNRPVEVGSDWYLEFQTTATGSGTGLCTQWRLLASTDQLQLRTWSDVSSPTATTWTTVASNVVNDPASQQPFTFHPADSTYNRQRVDLLLVVGNSQPGGAQVQAAFVARNTSTATVTNSATTNPLVSDTQVCQQVGRS
ncbi:MAG TPA: prepilin-type N-terminal cleavage/methylation domain-containing protein [Kineosporiaceae bacterium]|nr:prepilin-type N-terminal cleavage/methylation domain-containing protein [Kineosporiaceae bacterium]